MGSVRTVVRVSTLLLVGAAVLGAVAGCSAAGSVPTKAPTSVTTTTPASTPTPSAAATAGPSTVAFASLAIGDCLTLPAGSDQEAPATAPVVPCAQAHSSEVYALPGLQGSAFPGDDTVTAQADDACQSAFAGYVGVDVYDTQLNFSTFTPSQADWNAGLTHATCVVFSTQGDTTGSVRGIGSGMPPVAG
ncbi:septum formation family protein [Rathayibacter sp. CAU 1779]